jgi:hypothetical protein
LYKGAVIEDERNLNNSAHGPVDLMDGSYSAAIARGYIQYLWTNLANVQKILFIAAEDIPVSTGMSRYARDTKIRNEYMLIPDILKGNYYTKIINVNDRGIFRTNEDGLMARYRLGPWYGTSVGLSYFSQQYGRSINGVPRTQFWKFLAKYLVGIVSRQNRTLHKDFEYLLKHNMVFLPEVLIALGTMHREGHVTTTQFEAVQNILKRGITINRKVQSEKVEHYVSQIALHFEMKPIIKHVNMTPLLSELTPYNNEGKYYRALLYPDKQLTRERFDFFKWLIKHSIPQGILNRDKTLRNTVMTIFSTSGLAPLELPQVATPLLMDFIKWCVNNIDGQNFVTLFREVIVFAQDSAPRTMYGDKEQMIGVIKYLRKVSPGLIKGLLGPSLQRRVYARVTNISDQNPKAWIKHAVMGTKPKAPKKVKLDPKKLRQQSILHPEANGEDLVTMERVPLNKAVTLRGHDTNGKVRHIFHKNTVQNLMKNYRWYNSEGRYTPRNVGRGKHPVTRRSFYKENVVPLESRLSNQDRQLYSMLLHKNNAGGNKHAKINSVLKHLEEQQAAKRAAARKRAANAKRKRNATNAATPNNKGKKARSNSSSAINLTKTNSNANSSRGATNRAGPSG